MSAEYTQFSEDYAEQVIQEAKELEQRLDEKWPLQERVMHLEQIAAARSAANRRAELLENEEYLTTSLAERLATREAKPPVKVESGFAKLDEAVGGFRLGNTYLVAGLEKSGKSAFLMNILSNQLKAGCKVGYINTELSDAEFADRLAAIDYGISTHEAEEHPEYRVDWAERSKENFFYAGVEDPNDLKQDAMLSFKKTRLRMESFALQGARVIMLDNLTTFNTLIDQNKKGWEVLASCISAVVAFAKEHQIVMFIVIHTKPNVVFGETPSGVRNILHDDPRKIFSESVTVTRRPTLTDVYGGGGALSQVSGALLVWRPYQKFNKEEHQSMSMILLDSFRHAASGQEVPMLFDGAKSRFLEADNWLPEIEEVGTEDQDPEVQRVAQAFQEEML